MSCWLALVSVLWLSSASAQFGGFNLLPPQSNTGHTTGYQPNGGQLSDPLGSLTNAGQLEPSGILSPQRSNSYGGGIVGSVTKEAVAIKDPFEKTAVAVASSQCQTVKEVLGLNYESTPQPDYSQLSLNFITNDVKVKLNLPGLSSFSFSKWFKPKARLVIYLHGFTTDPTQDGAFTKINEAFLQQDIGNILALDASSLLSTLILLASTMVRFIGEQLGLAIVQMLMQVGYHPSSIHLVGHSLGAHIAGFAGKTVLEKTGFRVGRITGLDPAGPCFADVDSTLKLDENDASYVDVIHTDTSVFGLDERIGHADYYPNRGWGQPNCVLQTCSHSRAWELFAESVTNRNGFPAVSCSSWKAFQDRACNYTDVSMMGYASKPGTVGQYYLQTADSSPFALGENGFRHKNTDAVSRRVLDQAGVYS